jgi:hypothetical protein
VLIVTQSSYSPSAPAYIFLWKTYTFLRFAHLKKITLDEIQTTRTQRPESIGIMPWDHGLRHRSRLGSRQNHQLRHHGSLRQRRRQLPGHRQCLQTRHQRKDHRRVHPTKRPRLLRHSDQIFTKGQYHQSQRQRQQPQEHDAQRRAKPQTAADGLHRRPLPAYLG